MSTPEEDRAARQGSWETLRDTFRDAEHPFNPQDEAFVDGAFDPILRDLGFLPPEDFRLGGDEVTEGEGGRELTAEELSGLRQHAFEMIQSPDAAQAYLNDFFEGVDDATVPFAGIEQLEIMRIQIALNAWQVQSFGPGGSLADDEIYQRLFINPETPLDGVSEYAALIHPDGSPGGDGSLTRHLAAYFLQSQRDRLETREHRERSDELTAGVLGMQPGQDDLNSHLGGLFSNFLQNNPVLAQLMAETLNGLFAAFGMQTNFTAQDVIHAFASLGRGRDGDSGGGDRGRDPTPQDLRLTSAEGGDLTPDQQGIVTRDVAEDVGPIDQVLFGIRDEDGLIDIVELSSGVLGSGGGPVNITTVDFAGGWVFGAEEGLARTPYFGTARGREHDGIDLYQPNGGAGASITIVGESVFVHSGRYNGYGEVVITMTGHTELDQPFQIDVRPFNGISYNQRIEGEVESITVFTLNSHMINDSSALTQDEVDPGTLLEDGTLIGGNGESDSVSPSGDGFSSGISAHIHLEYHVRLDFTDGRSVVVPVDPQLLLGQDLQGPAVDLTDPEVLQRVLATSHRTGMAELMLDPSQDQLAQWASQIQGSINTNLFVGVRDGDFVPPEGIDEENNVTTEHHGEALASLEGSEGDGSLEGSRVYVRIQEGVSVAEYTQYIGGLQERGAHVVLVTGEGDGSQPSFQTPAPNAWSVASINEDTITLSRGDETQQISITEDDGLGGWDGLGLFTDTRLAGGLDVSELSVGQQLILDGEDGSFRLDIVEDQQVPQPTGPTTIEIADIVAFDTGTRIIEIPEVTALGWDITQQDGRLSSQIPPGYSDPDTAPLLEAFHSVHPETPVIDLDLVLARSISEETVVALQVGLLQHGIDLNGSGVDAALGPNTAEALVEYLEGNGDSIGTLDPSYITTLARVSARMGSDAQERLTELFQGTDHESGWDAALEEVNSVNYFVRHPDQDPLAFIWRAEVGSYVRSDGSPYGIAFGDARSFSYPGRPERFTLEEATFRDLHLMTNAQAGLASRAYGAFQIMQFHMDDLVATGRFEWDDTFSAEHQREALITYRAFLPATGIFDPSVPESVVAQRLSRIWAALPMDASQRTALGGIGLNRHTTPFPYSEVIQGIRDTRAFIAEHGMDALIHGPFDLPEFTPEVVILDGSEIRISMRDGIVSPVDYLTDPQIPGEIRFLGHSIGVQVKNSVADGIQGPDGVVPVFDGVQAGWGVMRDDQYAQLQEWADGAESGDLSVIFIDANDVSAIVGSDGVLDESAQAQWRERVEELVGLASEDGGRVVIVSSATGPDGWDPSQTSDGSGLTEAQNIYLRGGMADVLRDIAEEHGVAFVDGQTVLTSADGEIQGLSHDGIHLDDSGIAQGLYRDSILQAAGLDPETLEPNPFTPPGSEIDVVEIPPPELAAPSAEPVRVVIVDLGHGETLRSGGPMHSGAAAHGLQEAGDIGVGVVDTLGAQLADLDAQAQGGDVRIVFTRPPGEASAYVPPSERLRLPYDVSGVQHAIDDSIERRVYDALYDAQEQFPGQEVEVVSVVSLHFDTGRDGLIAYVPRGPREGSDEGQSYHTHHADGGIVLQSRYFAGSLMHDLGPLAPHGGRVFEEGQNFRVPVRGLEAGVPSTLIELGSVHNGSDRAFLSGIVGGDDSFAQGLWDSLNRHSPESGVSPREGVENLRGLSHRPFRYDTSPLPQEPERVVDRDSFLVEPVAYTTDETPPVVSDAGSIIERIAGLDEGERVRAFMELRPEQVEAVAADMLERAQTGEEPTAEDAAFVQAARDSEVSANLNTFMTALSGEEIQGDMESERAAYTTDERAVIWRGDVAYDEHGDEIPRSEMGLAFEEVRDPMQRAVVTGDEGHSVLSAASLFQLAVYEHGRREESEGDRVPPAAAFDEAVYGGDRDRPQDPVVVSAGLQRPQEEFEAVRSGDESPEASGGSGSGSGASPEATTETDSTPQPQAVVEGDPRGVHQVA